MSDKPDGQGLTADLVARGDWSAFEATDKNFSVAQGNVVPAGMVSASYIVPVGKTLFITQLSYEAHPVNLVADGEKSHHLLAEVLSMVGGWYFLEAHESGNTPILNKPMVFHAGEEVIYRVSNMSEHNLNLHLIMNGYEE